MTSDKSVDTSAFSNAQILSSGSSSSEESNVEKENTLTISTDKSASKSRSQSSGSAEVNLELNSDNSDDLPAVCDKSLSNQSSSPGHESVALKEDAKEGICSPVKLEKLDHFSKLDEAFLHQYMTEKERNVLDKRLDFATTLVDYFGGERTAEASESLKKTLGIGQVQISNISTSPRSIKFDDQKKIYLPAFGRNRYDSQQRRQQRPLPSEPPYFIYVSNIAYNATTAQIKEYFGGDKNVNNIYVYKYGNGNFAGDCFLELVNCRKALNSVMSLDRKQFLCRQLTIVAVNDEKSRRFSLNAMAENYKSRFVPLARINRPISPNYCSFPGSPRRLLSSKSPGLPRRSSFSNSQDVRRMTARFSNANSTRSLYSTPPIANRQFSRFYSNNKVHHHRLIDIPSPNTVNQLKESMDSKQNLKDYESKHRI